MAGFLPLFPWGTVLIGHHNINAPQWSAESLLLIRAKSLKHRTEVPQMVHKTWRMSLAAHRTEFLQIEHIDKVTLLSMVRWLGTY